MRVVAGHGAASRPPWPRGWAAASRLMPSPCTCIPARCTAITRTGGVAASASAIDLRGEGWPPAKRPQRRFRRGSGQARCRAERPGVVSGHPGLSTTISGLFEGGNADRRPRKRGQGGPPSAQRLRRSSRAVCEIGMGAGSVASVTGAKPVFP